MPSIYSETGPYTIRLCKIEEIATWSDSTYTHDVHG